MIAAFYPTLISEKVRLFLPAHPLVASLLLSTRLSPRSSAQNHPLIKPHLQLEAQAQSIRQS